jgi:hypothetical protein
MNYDLAVMALDGLARAPLHVREGADGITIEANAAAMKELARLCLLIAAEGDEDEAFELTPGTHVTADSRMLRLKVTA